MKHEGGFMKKFGFNPSKRHHFIEILDKDGKPTGYFRCVTCEREKEK